jgi:hypothetical protein
MGDITAADQSARSKSDASCNSATPECPPKPMPKVTAAYFARKTETTLYETVETKVDASNLAEVKKKHKNAKVGQTVKDKKERKEKEVKYVRSKLAYVGEKVYMLVETAELKGATISAEILGSENTTFVKPDEAASFFQDGSVKAKFDAKVGALSTDAMNTKAAELTNTAVFELEMKPEETDKKDQHAKRKEWGEKIDATTEKAALLHISVTAASGDAVEYSNEDDKRSGTTTDKGVFLNKKDAQFKLRFCDCGNKYNAEIKCTKYGSAYGPVYKGSQALDGFSEWDSMIKDGKLTTEDKEILIMMSSNEGNLDAIQSYDSEILTAGAMQKTVNSTGKGELYDQFKRFKDNYPEKWRGLMEDCKWSLDDSKGVVYDGASGAALKTKIRDGFTATTYGKVVVCPPLEPIVNLVKDSDFQRQQVQDFITRLKNQVLPLTPDGYSHKLSEYLKSKLGKATALDHHVNRPGYVAEDFGASLDTFYKKNPKVSKDPGEWGTNHATYETEILEDYGKTRRGTDMAGRYKKLKEK